MKARDFQKNTDFNNSEEDSLESLLSDLREFLPRESKKNILKETHSHVITALFNFLDDVKKVYGEETYNKVILKIILGLKQRNLEKTLRTTHSLMDK